MGWKWCVSLRSLDLKIKHGFSWNFCALFEFIVDFDSDNDDGFGRDDESNASLSLAHLQFFFKCYSLNCFDICKFKEILEIAGVLFMFGAFHYRTILVKYIVEHALATDGGLSSHGNCVQYIFSVNVNVCSASFSHLFWLFDQTFAWCCFYSK